MEAPTLCSGVAQWKRAWLIKKLRLTHEWAAIQNAVQTGGGCWLGGDGPELPQTSEAGGHARGSDGYIITRVATEAVPDGPAAATAGSDTAGTGSHYYPGGGENLPPMLAIPEVAEATARYIGKRHNCSLPGSHPGGLGARDAGGVHRGCWLCKRATVLCVTLPLERLMGSSRSLH